ncbi:MAG: prepilin-type N-terminal cleavage/methylation domain-containing protein [Sulfurimonas sp.]
MLQARRAFTLIEVMVSVMIISVVIMALLQMNANNTHIFGITKKHLNTNQYISLLIGNKDYGFENKNIYLDDLTRDFELENDLRRALKQTKVAIVYQELESIDLSEDMNDTEGSNGSGLVLEIGKSVLKAKDDSSGVMRLRIK